MIDPQQLRQLRSQMPDDALIGTLSRQDDTFGKFAAKQQAKNPDLPAKYIINRYYLGSASGKPVTDPPLASKDTKPTKAFDQMATDSYQPSTLSSIGQDAKRVFGGLASAVMNPIDTAKGMGKLAVGIGAQADKLLPQGMQMQGSSPYIDQGKQMAAGLGQDFMQRYGGSPLDAAKNAVRQPFSFASDASAALGIGAMATGSKTLAGMSRTVDPTLAAAKAVKGAGKLGGEALGLTTGTSAAPNAIARAGSEAAQANPKGTMLSYGSDSLDAMRGKTGPKTIVDEAKSALDQIKQQRADAYQPRLQAISEMGQQIDITPITTELQNQLKKFGIKTIKKADDVADIGDDVPLSQLDPQGVTDAAQAEAILKKGGSMDDALKTANDNLPDDLDFSRSTISDTAEQTRVRAALERVKDWGSQPGDLTPAGLDLLKRYLDDFYSPSGQARSMFTKIRQTVRQTLVDNVPGYETMVKEYEKASKEIGEIQSVLSLTDAASADSAIRKLTSIVRQNNEYRSSLVQHLKEVSGSDLTGMAAGSAMNPVAPRGLMRTVASANALYGFINPSFWLTLPATSPRLIGELLYAIGYTHGQVSNVMKLMQGKMPLPEGIGAAARQVPLLPSRTE